MKSRIIVTVKSKDRFFYKTDSADIGQVMQGLHEAVEECVAKFKADNAAIIPPGFSASVVMESTEAKCKLGFPIPFCMNEMAQRAKKNGITESTLKFESFDGFDAAQELMDELTDILYEKGVWPTCTGTSQVEKDKSIILNYRSDEDNNGGNE